jgi:uncharacterized protein (DUF4415 family)
MTRKVALSAPAKRHLMKEELIRTRYSDVLNAAQRAELAALAELPDDQIDTSDIPEQRDWSGARRGVFYRPLKRQITLRLDADVIDWFQQQAKAEKGYETRINQALREYVKARRK